VRILGIDPSYKRTGFAIIEDGELLYSTSLDLKKFKTKKEKRKIIAFNIKSIEASFLPDKIITERVRLFSRGFVSSKTIIALGSLITTIIDGSKLDVYSVDSRSFKAKVKNASCSKEDVISWVKQKFNIEADEDQADAIAIAFYGFTKNPLLRKENN